MNLNNNEQGIPEVQFKEYAFKLDAIDFACPSKVKAKPQRREPAVSSPRTVPIGKRIWTDVEPGEYSFSDCEVSKKVMYLLRHSQNVHREERWSSSILENWRKSSETFSTFSTLVLIARGKHVWQEEEEIRKDSSIVLILQEQLCISELFRDIQDAILMILRCRTVWLFKATSSSTKTMSDVLSICILFGIDTWRSKFEDKTDSILFYLFILWTKNHKDPNVIDLSVPRRAQYLHKAWKRHQDAVYWVDINLALKKGLKFYQTRSNAIIFQETLPAHCIPKVVRMETGEVIYEKEYMSPRSPPKISLKHEWKRELGSEHA